MMNIRNFFKKVKPKKITSYDEIIDLHLGGHLSEDEKWKTIYENDKMSIQVSNDCRIVRIDRIDWEYHHYFIEVFAQSVDPALRELEKELKICS